MWIAKKYLRQLVVAGGLLCFGSQTSSAAEPFYERLLQSGIQANVQGDTQTALKNLRLACFGLLDEPDVLARCLTHLAMAQGAAADGEAFRETFNRLVQVERRFQSYSKLNLSPGLKQAFEQQVDQWLEFEALAAIPVFKDIAQRKQETRLASLPLEERRVALEQRVTVEPEHLPWQIMKAEADFASGDYASALAAARAVLQRSNNPRIQCLSGRAHAALGECEAATQPLAACYEEEGTPVELEITETRLQCLMRVGDWQSAETLIGDLPPDQQKNSKIRRYFRDIRRARRAESIAERKKISTVDDEPAVQEGTDAVAEEETLVDAASGIEPTPTNAVGTTAGTTAGTTVVPPPKFQKPRSPEEEARPTVQTPPERSIQELPPEVRAQLAKARQLLRSGGSREELETAFNNMSRVADRYADHREAQYLVAEIAYRLRRWSDVVAYYRRGGDPGIGRPEQMFYFAVALYETGDFSYAEETLDRCLHKLQQNDFVRAYVAKIRGDR